MKTISNLKSWLRGEAQKKNTFSFFILFLYMLFSNSYVSALASILGTVVIAVFIGKQYYGLWFWASVIIYVLTMIMISWANQHVKQKIKDTTAFHNSLKRMSQIMRAWATELQQAAKDISNLGNRRNKVNMNTALRSLNFQSAAFSACTCLNEALTNGEKSEDVYVTVYQRYQKDGADKCRMIAYSCNHEPTSYRRTYDIPENIEMALGEVEYHTYLFALGNQELVILPDKESVETAFRLHPGCERREQEIQQYICIPITPAKKGVTFLLQVDTCVAGLFGNDEREVREFANNTVYPFAQFLHMVYEQARLIKQLTDKKE